MANDGMGTRSRSHIQPGGADELHFSTFSEKEIRLDVLCIRKSQARPVPYFSHHIYAALLPLLSR